MKLRIGPYLYSVRLVQGYIQHEGQKCLGLCDNEKHELLVSDVASESQQVQVVCHEYMEAWLYHFGGTVVHDAGKEMLCDLFGLAMTQFVLDFIRQFRQVEMEAKRGEADSERRSDGETARRSGGVQWRGALPYEATRLAAVDARLAAVDGASATAPRPHANSAALTTTSAPQAQAAPRAMRHQPKRAGRPIIVGSNRCDLADASRRMGRHFAGDARRPSVPPPRCVAQLVHPIDESPGQCWVTRIFAPPANASA